MIKMKKLNVKIVSKDEALWTKVRDSSRSRIEQLEEALLVERAMFDLAESKVKNYHIAK